MMAQSLGAEYAAPYLGRMNDAYGTNKVSGRRVVAMPPACRLGSAVLLNGSLHACVRILMHICKIDFHCMVFVPAAAGL